MLHRPGSTIADGTVTVTNIYLDFISVITNISNILLSKGIPVAPNGFAQSGECSECLHQIITLPSLSSVIMCYVAVLFVCDMSHMYLFSVQTTLISTSGKFYPQQKLELKCPRSVYGNVKWKVNEKDPDSTKYTITSDTLTLNSAAYSDNGESQK